MTASGRLTVLSAAERPYCEGLIALFQAAHPRVELDFVFGISTDLHRRYLAEVAAGGPTADLIWSSAMDLQMELVLGGHAQPHGADTSGLHESARYRDLACATTLEPLVTLVRREAAPVGTPAGTPGEVAALLTTHPHPVAILDIERNGLGFLAMLRDEAEDPDAPHLLDALARCRVTAAGSAPALVAAVETGGAALALHVLGSYARRAAAARPGLLALAESMTSPPGVSRIAFVPRGAANPDAARAFLDVLLSKEGQRALGAAGLCPIRFARRAEDGRMLPLDRGFERLLDPGARDGLLRRWRSALGREAAPPNPAETAR